MIAFGGVGKVAAWLRLFHPEQTLSGCDPTYPGPLAQHKCSPAQHSLQDGNRSCLLGVWVIPPCPVSSGRISSSPGVQGATGEVHDGTSVLSSARLLQPQGCARMHNPAAPRDSDTFAKGLGESKRKAQGRAAGKELASVLGNKE